MTFSAEDNICLSDFCGLVAQPLERLSAMAIRPTIKQVGLSSFEFLGFSLLGRLEVRRRVGCMGNRFKQARA